MAKSGQNKGNQHAILKPGELRRVQWSEGLSGPDLIKFVRHFKFDTSDEKQLDLLVRTQARKMFRDLVDKLPDNED